MKDKIRNILRQYYGEFNSFLENKYEDKIIEVLLTSDTYEKIKWATYNQLVIEIKNSIGDELIIKELQYKLTEDSNPIDACISVLEKMPTHTPEIERLYFKIRNF